MDKGCKAIYTYHMQSYPFASEDQKKAMLQALHSFFWLYRGKGKIVLTNRTQTPDEILGNLDELQQENLFPQTYEKWKSDMRETLEVKRPWVQVLYFILDLPGKKNMPQIEPSKALEQGGLRGLGRTVLQETYHTLSGAGLSALGIASQDIEEDEVQQAIDQEEILYNSFRKAGKITKATPSEIEFYLKSPFYRELGEVPVSNRQHPPVTRITKEGRTYLRPHKTYILDIFDDGVVKPDWNYLAIDHGDGRVSYQSHLVLTGMPDSINVLDNEWLYWLQEFDFPVDVCINFEIKDPAEEVNKVRRKKYDLRGDLETQHEHNMDNELDAENLDKGSEIERKLSKGQPLMEMEVVVCVAGQTKKQMRDRAQDIKTFYGSRMFSFSIVPAKAVYCFEKFFPWSEMDEYWRTPCDPGFISNSGIHCTAELGTPSGAWFASTWNKKVIRADFGWPMRHNLPGTVLLFGQMGSGKSATRKAIVKSILMLGGYVFSNDPKGEDHVFLRNPEIAEMTKLISFGVGRESTRLNVFRTSSNHDRAWQVAKDYLSLILNGRKSEMRSLIIQKLVRLTLAEENPNIFAFIELLKKTIARETDAERKREAQIIYDMLESYQEDPMAKIVFHDEPGELYLDQYRMVIADLKGLKYPKRGKAGEEIDLSLLDDTTKLSLGVVLLVSNIGREYIQHRTNTVLKCYSSDEDWITEGVSEFEYLKKELVKMSRSQYVVPIFATQEPADTRNPEIRNNLGWVMVGKMESKEQIDDACNLLGIEQPDEDLYSEFRNLESGNFFVRDPLGRKDVVEIFQPEDWLAMFDTRPKPKKKGSA